MPTGWFRGGVDEGRMNGGIGREVVERGRAVLGVWFGLTNFYDTNEMKTRRGR